MTDIEIWKTAVYDGEPYEGFEVSNLGKIMSLNYATLIPLPKTRSACQFINIGR